MAAGRCYLFNSYRSAWNAGYSLISFIKRISTAAEPYFVDFRDVWLEYNEELLRANDFAVEAIDLKVGRGEFIPIVGPSGCGKPTFMKLTTGLRMPSMGKILIDGQPVTGPLKISGTAFQAPSLLPWRTTVDNVLLPLEIVEPFRSNFKQKKKEYVERVRTLLQKVGVLLGFVIGSSRLAYVAMYPLMTAFNALPKAAFVPILVVWFGIGIGIGIGVGLAFAGLLVVGAMAMAMYELFSIIEKRTTGCGSPARCRKSPTRWSRCTAASGTGPMGEGRNAAGAALPPPGVPAPSWPCQTCGMRALIALALVSSSLLLAACSSGPPTRAARPRSTANSRRRNRATSRSTPWAWSARPPATAATRRRGASTAAA